MRILVRISVIFLTVFLVLPKTYAEENTGPALWSIQDEDTVIHLFGTLHMMNEGVEWATPKIMSAFEASDTLILEVGHELLEKEVIQSLIAKYGTF